MSRSSTAIASASGSTAHPSSCGAAAAKSGRASSQPSRRRQGSSGGGRALSTGKVAVVLPSGVTSFQAIQNRGSQTSLTYFAFDLLYLDGDDLRERSLAERKERLRTLVARKDGVIRYSDHVIGGGAAV